MGNFLEEASVGIFLSFLEVSGLSRGSLGRVGVPKLPQETIRTNIFPKSKTFRYLSSLGNRQVLRYYMACRQLLSRACMFLSVSIDGSRLSFRGMLLGVACAPEYTATWLPPQACSTRAPFMAVVFQVFGKTKNETNQNCMLAPLVGFLLHFGAT